MTSLLLDPEIVEILSPIAPEFPEAVGAPLKVPPSSREYALVGQAVDYAIRFELQRRHPDAISFPWVALRAVEATLPAIAPELLTRAEDYLSAIALEISSYIRNEKPSPESRRRMADCCIGLAKLESIYRRGQPRGDFDVRDEDAAVDVLRILAITPFSQLRRGPPLLLNPTFGPFSIFVGNADADLITGGALLDFKTTAKQSIPKEHGLQLVSYLILARKARELGLPFPKIQRVGILFTRHGWIEESEVSEITDSPRFRAAEADYLSAVARKLGTILPAQT